MSRPPESSFVDGHVDALSYIHFIHERIQCITKISFNRKILENDLQIKLTQNFLVPIPFDGFSFSAGCLPPPVILRGTDAKSQNLSQQLLRRKFPAQVLPHQIDDYLQ